MQTHWGLHQPSLQCKQHTRLAPSTLSSARRDRSFYGSNRAVQLAAVAGSAAPPGAVLVRDGVVVPGPSTAQQLLADHREWSYTTALVRQGFNVIDWELHVQRLVRNTHVLAQQRPPAYAGFLTWWQQQADQQVATAALQGLINPMVATALQELAPHSEGQQVMLTVVLGDKDAVPEVAGAPPLSVLVWAKALAPTAAAPAKVLVAGDPRPAAAAKHCDWVVARRPLEQLKQQAGVDELLLSDASGDLLEGLVSNFFVVADAAQLAACGQHIGADAVQQPCTVVAPGASRAGPQPSPQEHVLQGLQEQHMLEQLQQHQQQHTARPAAVQGLVLLTTGPGAGALPGVMQHRVLQACQQLQLPVVLQPARLDSVTAWREAFLTNCIKGLQAVQEARSEDGTVWEASQPATVTQLLQQEVCRLQTATDIRRWLHAGAVNP